MKFSPIRARKFSIGNSPLGNSLDKNFIAALHWKPPAYAAGREFHDPEGGRISYRRISCSRVSHREFPGGEFPIERIS